MKNNTSISINLCAQDNEKLSAITYFIDQEFRQTTDQDMPRRGKRWLNIMVPDKYNITGDPRFKTMLNDTLPGAIDLVEADNPYRSADRAVEYKYYKFDVTAVFTLYDIGTFNEDQVLHRLVLLIFQTILDVQYAYNILDRTKFNNRFHLDNKEYIGLLSVKDDAIKQIEDAQKWYDAVENCHTNTPGRRPQ